MGMARLHRLVGAGIRSLVAVSGYTRSQTGIQSLVAVTGASQTRTGVAPVDAESSAAHNMYRIKLAVRGDLGAGGLRQERQARLTRPDRITAAFAKAAHVPLPLRTSGEIFVGLPSHSPPW